MPRKTGPNLPQKSMLAEISPVNSLFPPCFSLPGQIQGSKIKTQTKGIQISSSPGLFKAETEGIRNRFSQSQM